MMGMDLETFTDRLEEGVREKLDGGGTVTRRTLQKPNTGPRTGLVIETPGYNISPLIFTDIYYELCKSEDDIPLIVSDILKTNEKLRGNFPHSDRLSSWENLKDSVFFCLLGTDKNTELLASVPHKEFPELGLSMVFRIPVENGTDRASILISRELAEQWGTDAGGLASCALANMPVQWKAHLQGMADIPDEVLPGKLKEQETARAMYVLANEENLYGASCLLYPGMLEEAAERLGSDYYVLPASMHEVILLKAEECSRNQASKLREMVMEINGSELAEEEVLADCVYYYRRETNEFFRC